MGIMVSVTVLGSPSIAAFDLWQLHCRGPLGAITRLAAAFKPACQHGRQDRVGGKLVQSSGAWWSGEGLSQLCLLKSSVRTFLSAGQWPVQLCHASFLQLPNPFSYLACNWLGFEWGSGCNALGWWLLGGPWEAGQVSETTLVRWPHSEAERGLINNKIGGS